MRANKQLQSLNDNSVRAISLKRKAKLVIRRKITENHNLRLFQLEFY